MDARAGNRGDVDDGALGRRQFVDQPARHHDRGKEVDPEYVAPGIDVGVDRAEPGAAIGLWRNSGVVNQRVQRAALQTLPDFLDGPRGVAVVGKVDLNVILRPRTPRAFFRERMPRTGDDAPARA